MTELEALRSVRMKFTQAIPQVVAYGTVRCLQADATVAMLELQADGGWTVNWTPTADPPVAVPPPSTPIAMEAEEVVTGEAVQTLADESQQSSKKSK